MLVLIGGLGGSDMRYRVEIINGQYVINGMTLHEEYKDIVTDALNGWTRDGRVSIHHAMNEG